ncbi:DDE-type integrase/transposase/recombinase [Micromonospora cathayae]|uniref:DDE-type integrase/transposase/recombinase n=1 Tax=Micromonospora cathayae TaxID=3028804 RepID=A0ABY7ZW20_9ACTN|nr:DDE-type integrase/transposase/recombinase [Micromonospora sp. HUAS 3]WDZ87244.1 DDE-type integrase/transposase/recombinase [Micromonospora sp. HUAS 3]
MSELAADGIPVAVTCRVLTIARQPYYRWLVQPVGDADLVAAYRANPLVDAHRDDPEFGYRFLVDEARDAGQLVAERTGWPICSGNGWWSAFGKRKCRGKGGKVGPPVHDDLVCRDFTAVGPNRLWLADITEHHTTEGKLYLCAIKDVWSRRIVGYSIDSRMKSRLAVTALDNAAARRGGLAGCVLHTDRGSQGGLMGLHQTCPRLRPDAVHGQHRRLLRQLDDRGLLVEDAGRAAEPPPLAHPYRTRQRNLRLPRDLAQSPTPA